MGGNIMLELYSKKRFVIIFKDCLFDGNWKNSYLKENDTELGALKKSGNFIILKSLSIKFPYNKFLKLIESPEASFEDLLRISPNVLKISDSQNMIEQFAFQRNLFWRSFFNVKTQKQSFFAFKL